MPAQGTADVNNNADQQNFSAAYTGLADGAPGNTVIHRRGPVTFFRGTGNLTASRVWQPGTVAAEGWTIGDILIAAIGTHTGGGFTVTIENLAGVALSTWAALLANGGEWFFDGTDWQEMIPGASTT